MIGEVTGVVPVAASLVIGVVFVVAGAAKLAARESWRVEARALGAPTWAVPLLPWVELMLGALLVAQVARRPLALAAGVLLVSFTVSIARVLRAGRRPPCACFGSWSVRPLGRVHVIRNVGLIALTAVAAT